MKSENMTVMTTEELYICQADYILHLGPTLPWLQTVGDLSNPIRLAVLLLYTETAFIDMFERFLSWLETKEVS